MDRPFFSSTYHTEILYSIFFELVHMSMGLSMVLNVRMINPMNLSNDRKIYITKINVRVQQSRAKHR